VTALGGLILAQQLSMPNASAPGVDPLRYPLLVLKRWFGSVTLSSPEPLPSQTSLLLAWGIAAAILIAIAVIFQGPKRALRQLFDIPGHLGLVHHTIWRLKTSGRMLVFVFGTAIVSATCWQFTTYTMAEKKEDLAILFKSKSRMDVASEQGILAAMSPARDVLALGDTTLLLILISALVFKRSADRWSAGEEDYESPKRSGAISGWMTVSWCAAWLYVLYRLVSVIVDREGLPLSMGFLPEVFVVPLLALFSDALLLSWLLTELRSKRVDSDSVDMEVVVRDIPSAFLCCAFAMPARWVSLLLWLAVRYVPGGSGVGGHVLRDVLRGWGLVVLTAAGLVGLLFFAAIPTFERKRIGIWRRLFRAIRHEGGHLVASILFGGVVAGSLAALAYLLVLALPSQPWLLSAADSYAHYGTLPVSLVVGSALVGLGERALSEWATEGSKPAIQRTGEAVDIPTTEIGAIESVAVSSA
jgi:hypothetical protein